MFDLWEHHEYWRLNQRKVVRCGYYTRRYRSIKEGKLCRYCSKNADGVDHKHPLVFGGSNRAFNLVPCCVECNTIKNNMSFDLFAFKNSWRNLKGFSRGEKMGRDSWPEYDFTNTPRVKEQRYTFFWKSPLGQWHIAPMVVDGVRYNCCEQYMMAQKAILFNDEETLAKIMATEVPKEQKNLGREVKNFDLVVWEANARDIVERGNHAKFSQHPYLWEKLQATEGTTLVEASPYDLVWGVGLAEDDPLILDNKNWRGKNWLGYTLTKVRERIKFENAALDEMVRLGQEDGLYD